VHRPRRFGERCGGAATLSDAEEHFRDADPYSAQEKESAPPGEEISDSNADSEINSVANRDDQKESFSHSNANDVIAPKEKVFAHRDSNGNAPNLSNSFAERFSASKEKTVGNFAAIRVAVGDSD